MLGLVIVLLSLIYLGGQESGSQEAVRYALPSRFELSAEKPVYNIAEPVEIIVTLSNDRPYPIRGDFYLGLAVNDLWVYYRKAGSEFVRYFPRWVQQARVASSARSPVEIPAFGKKETRERLLYDTYEKRFVLAEPGEYEFKATFNLGSDRIIESNIVRVTVVEPPENERDALAALSDPVLASFIEGDLRPGLAQDDEVEAGAEKAKVFLVERLKSNST